MSKPFDATTKQIVEIDPQDWLELTGFPRLPVEVIDADLATVTTDADRILRTIAPPFCLFHFEFEAGRDASDVPRRAHRYNALAGTRYALPVATVVYLLNPNAGKLSGVTGIYEESHPQAGTYLRFQYQAVRVWELPVQFILTSGIATLPLALLSDTTGMEPKGIVETIYDRLVAEVDNPDKIETLLSSAYILAGLRFSDTIVQSLFKGVLNMEESSTYQAILTRGILHGQQQGLEKGLEQGRTEEARRLLLVLGEPRLGSPNAAIYETIQSIQAIARLEYLIGRLSAVETWNDLLNL